MIVSCLAARSPGDLTCNLDDPDPVNCLGVFGLNFQTSQEMLERLFGQYGRLQKVVLITNKAGKKRTEEISRGFAFVYYESVESASAARDAMNGREIDGRKIRVDFSVTQSGHKPTPGMFIMRGRPIIFKRETSSRGGPDRQSGGHRDTDTDGYSRQVAYRDRSPHNSSRYDYGYPYNSSSRYDNYR